MKKSTLLLTGLIALFLFTTQAGAGSLPENPKKNSPSTAQIEAFFLDHLSRKTAHYQDNTPIRLADIARQRAWVWEAWKKANLRFEEERLIPLAALENEKTGHWALPPTLEPNAVMPYYFGAKGEKPANGFPLFVYLHGSGNKEEEWKSGIRLARQFDDAPSVYFIPQIPNVGDYYRWYQKSKQFALEKLLRLAFLSDEMDANRVYFFGISEGGYGSQRLASFYADYLAGAGPMAGGEPLKNAPPENCRNIAFSLRTGANDLGFYRNTLTRYTREAFDRLQQEAPESFTHFIELIPGRGHGIDYAPTPAWLRQYSRNPYPKVVSWENFRMDGRYRKGFYNLLAGEPAGDGRTYYELLINGNELSLQVSEVTYQTTETDPRWGIEMKFTKSHTPATRGKVTIFLCPELVDLSKTITLTVNGKQVFKGKVKPELRHLVTSCAAFFDPARLYPAAIEVDLEQ